MGQVYPYFCFHLGKKSMRIQSHIFAYMPLLFSYVIEMLCLVKARTLVVIDVIDMNNYSSISLKKATTVITA